MKPKIREFTPDDYQGVVDVDNAEYPEYPGTAEEARFQDQARDPKCKFRRWVAEIDGHVVGYVTYDQWSGQYHPRKFTIYSVVHPTYQGKGIGKALYSTVVDALKEFDPLTIRSNSQESRARAIRFLTDRGFREDMRTWENRLHVDVFDLSAYSEVEDKPRSHGIEFKTLRELESDPGRDQKLYELHWELIQDVPHSDELTKMPFEIFKTRVLDNPNFLPDAYWIAVHGDEYVGTSGLSSSQGNKDLYTGLTGVKRAYRHKGIALALKIMGIRYAKVNGNPIIKTWNESNNRPMLEINERLGFVKEPAWLEYIKVLKEA
jgi:GNAT superfamily N-acetyltransferase